MQDRVTARIARCRPFIDVTKHRANSGIRRRIAITSDELGGIEEVEAGPVASTRTACPAADRLANKAGVRIAATEPVTPRMSRAMLTAGVSFYSGLRMNDSHQDHNGAYTNADHERGIRRFHVAQASGQYKPRATE